METQKWEVTKFVTSLADSYDFSIKWLTPFYPANPSQAAGGGEKCMDYDFSGYAADR